MAVPMPEDYFEVSENMIAFVHEYKGKIYVNIRKTYIDRDSDERSLGKGLSISIQEFDMLTNKMNDIMIYINRQCEAKFETDPRE